MSPNLATLLDTVVERHTTGDPFEALQTVEDIARLAFDNHLGAQQAADRLDDALDVLEGALTDWMPMLRACELLRDARRALSAVQDSVSRYDDATGYELDAAVGVLVDHLDAS